MACNGNAKMHRFWICSLPSWKYSQSRKQEQRAEATRMGMSTRILQNNRLNYRIQSLHVGMQRSGSSVVNRRTKETLAYVGQKVWLVSNWMQHMPLSGNIAQHGVQMNATCCAQHVGTTFCIHLHRPLRWFKTVFHFLFQLNFMKGLLVCS